MKFLPAVTLLFALVPAVVPAAQPVINNAPASQIVLEGNPAVFAVGASGSAPLRYQWRRNGTPIPQATTASYTLLSVAQSDHNETFSVQVSNAFGTATSPEALLRVDPGIVTTQTVRLLDISNTWAYNGSNINLGSEWIAPGYPDAGWPSGRATFDGKKPTPRSTLPNGEPVRTQLVITNASGTDISTFYFRAHFTNTVTNAFAVTLRPTFLVDDGVAAYLNGAEFYRLGVASNAVFTDWATRTFDAVFEGPFTVNWPPLPAGDNVVAVEVHQVNATSSDLTFGMILDASYAFRWPDTNPPAVASSSPAPGTVVNSLASVEVTFSEAVEGVDAADLLVNGIPAASVTVLAPSQYRWDFPIVTNGTVAFSWAPNHGIHDVSSMLNAFTGTGWTVAADPNVSPVRVWISECMAANDHTLRDEDGDYSDWVEIYNDQTSSVSLEGWSLTDTTNNLAKWRFPAVSIPGRSYLLIFASGKNRTNPVARLHANFSLEKSGEYLGLVHPSGQIVSEFRPALPAMGEDVSFGRDLLDPSVTGYYATPTPGAANTGKGAGFGPEVQFSVTGCTFPSTFALALSTPDAPTAVIRYVILTNAFLSTTTNVPTATSPLYTGPITVDKTMMVRARAFLPSTNYFPGAPRTESYLQLGANTGTFDSDLPLVVVHTLSSATIPGSDPDRGVIFALFEPRFGVTRLTDMPTLVTRAGINVRGSSSSGFPKSPFAIELQDEFGADADHEVLGMPAESDWVVYPPDCYDLSLMNNPLLSAISRGLDRYAPRTRFVELIVNNTGGPVAFGAGFSAAASPQYRGLYVLIEKIKRSSGRVDIDPLQPEHTNTPAITGGYLLKIDRADADEVSFKPFGYETTTEQTMIYQDPKGPEIATAQRAAQTNYLRTYLNSFYQALTNANWLNRTSGWAPYVNWESAIDHQLINLVCFNTDALRLSAFFYKPRSQPLEFGPVWDCDRGLGSSRNDRRPFNPRRWAANVAETGIGSTDYFNSDSIYPNPWFSRMTRDPDFWQAWIDRYQAVRRDALDTNTLFALVDGYANQVRRAQPREVARWGGNGNSDTRPRSGAVTVDGYTHTFDGTYNGEVAFLKRWQVDRLNFMDTNFLAAPSLGSPGGLFTNTYSLTVADLSGKAGSQLYYTLDGTDPRAAQGAIAPGAQPYTGPILLSSNARVVVRARNTQHANLTGLPGNPPLSSVWSGPVAATFVGNTPSLRITEIMFHPSPPPAGNTNDADNFEFVELSNVGTASLNLSGFHLGGGIDFTFSNLALAAGQSCVVVSDLAAFQSRYGLGPRVAGQYTNRLANDGDRLVLQGPLQEPVLEFRYEDRWYPSVDGAGLSLVIVDPNAPAASWGLKSSWRPSGAPGGSPGTNEISVAAIAPVVISEILTHTDLPQVDAIELHNPTLTNVDLGGWFLSDDFDVPQKYRIPSGTILPAAGYVTLYETNSFGAGAGGFRLSSLGDSLWLFSGGPQSNLTGYATGGSYGAQQNGITFGRHVNSLDEEDLVTETVPSLGTGNAGAKVGPVIISELNYHPPDFLFGWQAFDNLRDEFIQLANLSGQPVALFDPLAPTNTWRLRGAVDFDFPANTTLPAGGALVVVGFNPTSEPGVLADFLGAYPGATNATLFGPWSGKLGNDSETIQLLRPDVPQADGSVPWILVERVAYRDDGGWPTNADGSGLSLHRNPLQAFGNDPVNWSAQAPTPGLSPLWAADTDGDGMPDAWELANGLQVGINDAGLDPDLDGMSNLQEFRAATDPQDAASVLKLQGALLPGTGIELRFTAQAYLAYTVQASDTSPALNWQPWQQVAAGPASRVVTLTNTPGSVLRFYRVVTPPVP